MREQAHELGEDQLDDLADCCVGVVLAAMELVEDSQMALRMSAGEVARSMPVANSKQGQK